MFSSHLALSLPSVVTFSDGSTITYLYTADGRKLRTTHVINGTTTTTDYCGNVIYEGTTPKKLLTDEGYVDLTTATPTYYYYLKDHQGNNRVVINSSGAVQETNHYYPFGGLFSTSTNIQPYKYNGKELDTKKGLNWYDYGARHYDAVLGRWHVVDPLAEDMATWSPYTYCFNNPMKFVDEEGESPLKVLKVAFNIGKRTYKTYKRSGKLNLKQALKEEGVNIVDNVQTLFDDEASTTDKIFAGIDLLTGFGGEVKDASKSLGIIDDAVGAGKHSDKAVDTYQNVENVNKHKNDAKRNARIEGKKQKESQRVSEDYVKYKAKKLEKEHGKDARRRAHDAKDNIGRDRTKEEIDNDYNYNIW